MTKTYEDSGMPTVSINLEKSGLPERGMGA